MRRSKTSSAQQQGARGNFTPPPRTATSHATSPAAAAPAGNGGKGSGSSSRFAPRNWRVPTRLNAILLIPVLVGLVMGGFQVKGSVDTWQEAQDAEKTAVLIRAASEYGQALLNERDLTAAPLLQGKRTSSEVTQAYALTDEAAKKFKEATKDLPEGQGLERRLGLFADEEPKLGALRKAAYTQALDPVKTEEGYVQIQHSLMELSNELGLGTGNITAYGRTVYAVQLAKAAASLQRSIGMHLLIRPSGNPAKLAQQTVAFNSYNYLEQIALAEFRSGGTEGDVNELKRIMKGKAEDGAKKLAAAKQQADQAGVPFVPPPSKNGSILDGMAAEIGQGKPTGLKQKGVTPEVWMAASTAKFDGYSEIENNLVDKAVEEAGAISSDAKTDAITNGLIVVIALLTSVILAGMMARQMSNAMRQLRTAAFGIAEQRLPMLVDQLSRTEPGRVDTRVEPIPITSHDEIGEVARAFDQVHREAVRLAAEQAMLRGNVNAIFTNLSRRNQSLIEGQLTLITDLENNEADPDQLENLFKLDHLATRMRRNGENLLVLAGEEPGRRWNQPVPLVDVLRAAASEVEMYERIELTGVPESEIHGQAVTDLVHLLAELLENATTFSSPQTKVRVTATRLPDGRVMVEIHDKGIGLTAEDFADINHKLANPPTVDAAVSQRMGLFVVGRLADRHSIRVQLRPSGEQAGTTSLVMLPDAITHGGGGEPLPHDDFTVSSIIPEQQSYESAPMRTAAELGFDDSAYGNDGDDTKLDPVGRSLIREERRAQLEAQATGDRPLFRDELQQGSYDDPQQSYEDPQQQYEQPQQPAYDQGGYDDYPAYQTYPEAEYQEPAAPQATYEDSYDSTSHQGPWQDQNSYQGAYEPEFGSQAESAPGAPASDRERVGFDRPGSTPAPGPEVTDVGLPRRGGQQHWQPGAEPAGQSFGQEAARQPVAAPQPQQDAPQQDGNGNGPGTDDWRSSNDERWQRAEKLREPKAGGVTSSGLPRRVPKANLVEGTAEQTPQGGPQVSRAPEDVRGRLSNLRRGVQQGRNAGTDTNTAATYDQNGGHGNTYNQER
ncbi:nitrate- and nitrite sensing domain-containing protein [Streptomyces sp. ISL-96]|uniref:sensor histidine kinase n=1 Tax=Streptomyces sp. ISL-96 TaxID=2819191 RepID=UPI001BE9D01F|nr:nitrate- and nitrite sensing domain-containing protein [Streptomyces sp. ISL-96]MBT2487538.1 nitrate- and nitrite sensing domain-containing protein [Streptomyces sp. ISL-96]